MQETGQRANVFMSGYCILSLTHNVLHRIDKSALSVRNSGEETPALYNTAYLPRHNKTRGSVGDLEHNSTVACTQLTDLLKVIVLQLSHLLLLCQKGLQAFPLLLVQLELL